jgi:hypothetical protein
MRFSYEEFNEQDKLQFGGDLIYILFELGARKGSTPRSTIILLSLYICVGVYIYSVMIFQCEDHVQQFKLTI